jgi:phosphotransferase system enzyme I (PtsI)
VSDAGEIDDTLALMAVCRQELTETGTGFNPDVKIGIMIETPAAVLAAAILAEKVAFFSIGTNDLTQYVMAADRNDGLVRNYYNVSHPAVMRAIKLVTEEAHVRGITISICGEAASDVMLTQQLLQNGADALSVNATAVARVKAHIREM